MSPPKTLPHNRSNLIPAFSLGENSLDFARQLRSLKKPLRATGIQSRSLGKSKHNVKVPNVPFCLEETEDLTSTHKRKMETIGYYVSQQVPLRILLCTLWYCCILPLARVFPIKRKEMERAGKELKKKINER